MGTGCAGLRLSGVHLGRAGPDQLLEGQGGATREAAGQLSRGGKWGVCQEGAEGTGQKWLRLRTQQLESFRNPC